MVSAMSSSGQQLRAFEVGADDYLVKPFDPQDLRARVRLHFQLRNALASASTIRATITSRDSQLRELAEQHTREVIAVQDTAVFMLAKVAESRDQETGGHLTRMRAYSQILGEQLAREGPYANQISRQFLDDLYRSSPLHDIGKVGIRDAILLKPGRLTPEEFETMQQHTVIGANVLGQAVTRLGGGGFLAMAAIIARFHHERFDGTGYPAGLVGQEIPLPARIVAVADVYDALTSVRPYKPAYPTNEAKAIIQRGSGRHFDPVIVEMFCQRFEDFLRAQEGAVEDFPIGYGAMAFREYDLAVADL
jgi:putative two-component system response regulator